MNKRKWFAGMATAAIAATTLVGCSSGGSTGGSGNSTLTVGIFQELNGVFSPMYYQSSYDGDVINMVYQSLLKYDVEGELQPELATGMPEVSEDGLTYTFKLKEGVKFSDGTELTASDVKYSFTVLADPTYSGRMSSIVENVVGYDEYHNGDAKELAGIETPDDYTIVFKTVKPQIDALANFGTFGICSDEQFEYTKGDTSEIESNTDKPIGSGAYKLNKYDKATGASLVRNENFVAEEGQYSVDSVIIKKTDTATEYDELVKGNIDLIPSVMEQNKVGPASLEENLTFNDYVRAGVGYIAFNTVSGPTADVSVRQALSYATDRQTFVDSFYKYEKASEEVQKIPLGYVPQAYWNPASKVMGDYVTGKKEVEGLVHYEYDLDKAKELLDKAGWKEGKDGIREKDGEKLTIKFLATPENSVLDTLLPMISKSWKEIGVELVQSTVDFNTLTSIIPDDTQVSEWNAFFLATGYTGVSDSDSNIQLGLNPEGKPNQDNYPRITDEEMNEALKAGYNTADAKVSEENYLEAMVRSTELAPYLPLYGNQYFDLYNKRVEGLETGPVRIWSQALDTVTLK